MSVAQHEAAARQTERQATEDGQRQAADHRAAAAALVEAEARVCAGLSAADRFGVILHHNVDKVLLCGGAAHAAFAGGEVLEPIEIYLAGRATAEHAGARIPVHELAIGAGRERLSQNLRGLDVGRHVRIVSRIRPGSSDLTRLFARGGGAPPANDTSCGAGLAPLTDLERAVLAVEQALNAGGTKRAHAEIGEDIKVMGVRHDRAFVGSHVTDLHDHARKKAAAGELAAAAARTATALEVGVTVNAADDLERGEVFLTVTGTSAEAGDDGEVGRGIAATIATDVPGTEDATCLLVNDIGRRVDEPRIIDVELAPQGITSAVAIGEIARAQLARLGDLRDELLRERLRVY